MAKFNLPAGKWVTVGSQFGFKVKALSISVETDQTCSWRRIGLAPWGGKFQRSRTVWMWNVVVQVKSPVATICTAFEPD